MSERAIPEVCDMCGSEDIRVQVSYECWILKCFNCGHWDQIWKDNEESPE